MTDIPHGTSKGYKHHKCRCEQCKQAIKDERKARKESRLADLVIVDGKPFHPNAPHGTQNGYNNYGCRCDKCVNARHAIQQQYRKKNKESRKEIDGRLTNPGVEHGTLTGYSDFCRCVKCTNIHTDYNFANRHGIEWEK